MDALLSTREVAELLGCSPRHVMRLRDAELLPCVYLGSRSVRWRAADVERAIEQMVAVDRPAGMSRG